MLEVANTNILHPKIKIEKSTVVEHVTDHCGEVWGHVWEGQGRFGAPFQEVVGKGGGTCCRLLEGLGDYLGMRLPETLHGFRMNKDLYNDRIFLDTITNKDKSKAQLLYIFDLDADLQTSEIDYMGKI